MIIILKNVSLKKALNFKYIYKKMIFFVNTKFYKNNYFI